MGEKFQLRLEVEDLLHEYVECLDEDRLEDWPQFFVENGPVYKVIARENVDLDLPMPVIYCTSRGMMEDRITSLREANIYPPHHNRHLVSNVRTFVTPETGEIQAQSNYAILQTLNDGETRIYNAGKYQDIIVRENGALKFKEKLCIYDTSRIQTLMVTPI